MAGVVLIAHEPLATALLACARHVYGAPVDGCEALDVPPTSQPAEWVARAQEAIARVDDGQGVLVLTDLFGATPCNICSQLVRSGRTEVLSGVNLAMLLRALTYRSRVPLDALVDKASAGATAAVMKIVSTAPQNQPSGPGAEASPGSPNDGNQDAIARLHHQQ